MLKYTANYCKANCNFVISGIKVNNEEVQYLQSIKIVKNIINRGSYNSLSNFLKTHYDYELNCDASFVALASNEKVNWSSIIKGAGDSLDNPALDFYYNVIEEFLGEYSFVRQLIIPEVYINDVIKTPKEEFKNCCYDFYIPQINAVIEIDGLQHKFSQEIDEMRDKVFDGQVIRIKTYDIRNRTAELKSIMESLYQMLLNSELINAYKNNLNGAFLSSDKIELTQIARLEICFLEMLKNRND